MVVDFHYDFSSPFAYLASTQVEGLARRTGCELRWRPLLLLMLNACVSESCSSLPL